MTNPRVQVWRDYWGVLRQEDDEGGTFVLHGFENESPAQQNRSLATIANGGGCFGFVASGNVQLQDQRVLWHLQAGQWFCLPDGGKLNLSPHSRLVVSQLLGYHGPYAMGGPLEAQGRLRYIDGCSDTLLCAPPLLGDPCLNHLHFPAAIQQTAHTHPSLRAGIIARGQGVCEANQQTIPLTAGMVFYIGKQAEHRFITEANTMDVLAFHPDSDWGPTHQDHPMVNRTWVDGHKIDNLAPQHQAAAIVQGR